MVGVRLLHVYAHLMFRALECGIGEEFERLGLNTYYNNYIVWQIICVHLCFYELDLIG
jgi:hypothetical protein